MADVTSDTPADSSAPGPTTATRGGSVPSVIHEGLPTQLPDIDPDETQDWIDSFNASSTSAAASGLGTSCCACWSGPGNDRSGCHR